MVPYLYKSIKIKKNHDAVLDSSPVDSNAKEKFALFLTENLIKYYLFS